MLWPFSNIVEKSWIADAGLRAGVAGASASRRPWQIEETDACFILRDANGRALAYCDAAACSPATRHGGIAANIARIRHWSIASLPHSAPHICRGLRKSGMAQCGLATIIESWLSSV